ncbi:HD domain-containing protein [Chryseobacterium taklimakanense]|uniref:HD domain-containing protein n=1 Tax=Chryseobacterium taklimakanense TaxID=536441 RepID=UPI0023F9AD52|nr:HD domain-containing protein [Chryseobacterium taklimakanense]
MDEILAKITDFGDQAHGEQLRKYAPDRYMVHPVRVMQKLKSYTDDITVLAAALLHDVLEDTPVTRSEMQDFLETLLTAQQAERTAELVVELSDVYVKKDFPNLNRRTRKSKELARLEKTSADSQTIKYSDILDNSLEISDQDPQFAGVYLSEVSLVLKKLDKGNPELRKEAIKAVEQSLQKIKRR